MSLGVVVMAHQRGQHPEVVRRRADARERRWTDHDVASGVREQQVVQHGRVVEVVERHAGLGQHRGAGQPRDVAGQRRELVLGQLVERRAGGVELAELAVGEREAGAHRRQVEALIEDRGHGLVDALHPALLPPGPHHLTAVDRHRELGVGALIEVERLGGEQLAFLEPPVHERARGAEDRREREV